ncbi:uncharacterized protein LOC121420388 [Lytechinus variegatus]|uniref:uncharacterized protein LOC121420388 n=1 Tax=Lytechinus variegatus TaxID=7654 RepID=UPI001BB1EB82|nr:uncharacterized protein LOC121420388 [Lytechinus variegatus]
MPKVKQGRKNAGKPATPRRTRKAGTGTGSASSTSVVEEDVAGAGAGTSIINDGKVSAASTGRRSAGMRHTHPSVADLFVERNRLMLASRAQSTHSTYRKAWDAFEQFRLRYHYDINVEPDVEQVAQFISFLSWHGYAGSTISTYISGLAFGMQASGWPDTTDCFAIRRLVDGCRRKFAQHDTRCPITFPILKSLIHAIPHVCPNSYNQALFRAAFLVAFFGFLRVGEFTAQSKRGPLSLLENDVCIRGEGPRRKLEVTIRRSKSDQTGKGCCIIIPTNTSSPMCPVLAVDNYLSIRSSSQGRERAFFRHFSTQPLTRHEFGKTLKQAISFLNLPVEFYSSHSFRIGAATSAAMAGIPDARIQNMGRWASLSHRRYIRANYALLGDSL